LPRLTPALAPFQAVTSLTPGCQIIYYKGKMLKKEYAGTRLSPEPHYFGSAVIGNSIPDPGNPKNSYCEILDYKPFANAVPIRIGSKLLEVIPDTKRTNYWRDGVRQTAREVYESIISHATVTDYVPKLSDPEGDFDSYGGTEGTKKQRYTTYYERRPYYRNKAIEIHGLSCMVCGTNFQNRYGSHGSGFIHVHHNKPVAQTGPTRINPATDMSVLCPNCHAMVHRRKNQTLTVDELRTIFVPLSDSH
jgi:putative restriction endonuclease